jgi:hypothetical protein
MARLGDHEKTLTLRKQGMSYSQIRSIVKVSKSTLSLWLKNYPLSKERIKELRAFSEQRIERFRETMRQKREKRLTETYQTQKQLILPLSNRELFIAGLLLYWGEGTKGKLHGLSVSNSDPSVIRFFIYWLKKSLAIPKKKIRILLHLYNDMDINNELNYWSKTLRIPLRQFNRSYIKKTSSTRINHKGGFGHGTCNAKINSVPLAEKIFMSLKVISNKYQ